MLPTVPKSQRQSSSEHLLELIVGMGTNTKMIFEYSFFDIRIYSNIRFYTYPKK